MRELRERGRLVFSLFERAALKGHEESIWFCSVVKDADIKKGGLIEAFAKTEVPLGWYFAGWLSDVDSREELDFYKKSAEGGCSWGQLWYAKCFRFEDDKVYVEWLEKSAKQNNPWALDCLGDWFRYEGDMEKAVFYHRMAAEQGVKLSMYFLSPMLMKGEGCKRDLKEAAFWDAKKYDWNISLDDVFWEVLSDARSVFNTRSYWLRLPASAHARTVDSSGMEELENLDCDFDQLCYVLGWGLYWHVDGAYYDHDDKPEKWEERFEEYLAFGDPCIDFYCDCFELQQEAIFTFLLIWNHITGVKGPGQMIAKMVWEGREENLVKSFSDHPDFKNKKC
jgi:hypothetical protein